MSAETCGGHVPMIWEFSDGDPEVTTDRFFLRDDKDAGLCDHARWSLFRDFPKEHYGRLTFYSYISQGSAIIRAHRLINESLLK